MWPSALRMRFQWFPHSGKTRMTTHMWRVGPLAHRRWPGSCAGGAAVQPPDAIIACPPRIEDHLKRLEHAPSTEAPTMTTGNCQDQPDSGRVARRIVEYRGG